MLAHTRVETECASHGLFVGSASLKGWPVPMFGYGTGVDSGLAMRGNLLPVSCVNWAGVISVAASRSTNHCTSFSGKDRWWIVCGSGFTNPMGVAVSILIGDELRIRLLRSDCAPTGHSRIRRCATSGRWSHWLYWQGWSARRGSASSTASAKVGAAFLGIWPINKRTYADEDEASSKL